VADPSPTVDPGPSAIAGPGPLSGHTLPDAGAVMKHAATGVRLVLSWDACAASPLGLRDQQVTPNHVLYEIGGEPVFGDGAPAHDEGFLDVALEDVIAQLTPAEVEEAARAHGSPEAWARLQQPGLIGAANTVVIDGASGYFPPGPRRGRLVYEDRSPGRHVVTAECVEFFRPRYDLLRARRTISLSSDGVAWIVDDYRAATEHRFHWQAYLRRGCALSDRRLAVRLPGRRPAWLAWHGAMDPGLHRFPAYPRESRDAAAALPWPDAGSERLRLGTTGRTARFAVCIVPWDARELAVRQTGEFEWEAHWAGGSERFHVPGTPVTG
jgi:hypothetical protein